MSEYGSPLPPEPEPASAEVLPPEPEPETGSPLPPEPEPASAEVLPPEPEPETGSPLPPEPEPASAEVLPPDPELGGQAVEQAMHVIAATGLHQVARYGTRHRADQEDLRGQSRPRVRGRLAAGIEGRAPG
jgi:hypothetical protein